METSRAPLSIKQYSAEPDDMSGMSIREQARPYLLATARVPINVFDFTWSTGANRSINRKHVRTLCRIFSERKLQRENEQHYVRAISTKEEVTRMINSINKELPVISTLDPCASVKPWPVFNQWEAINQTKIELIAGQHRIEALKEYAQHLKWQDDQLWWICDIYDKGISLIHILMKLYTDI
jgi:hypothetical protein